MKTFILCMIFFGYSMLIYEGLKWFLKIGEYSMDNNKTKFKLDKVKNHMDITATVEDHDLPAEIIDVIKHTLNHDLVTEFEVTGEMSVEFDDYTPIVTIVGLGIAYGDNEYIDLSLDDENFNFIDLKEQIEQDDSMNYYDYMAGQIDSQYELMMETQRDE